ncbi:efflux RND transporter periplasmic adaptor subunit [uncultured Sunxiuqinia sp.]|uniref:efflux RND transporter periplasmic adaptor subunit n=1 Tax=uncultured Sunxiuqinia sp. TaxID=1573825 RepID=UPI002AA7B54D|nr:efflux RND transporter periplasmic adaptor subunit [uncultured Sunxiuqinia sp.]
MKTNLVRTSPFIIALALGILISSCGKNDKQEAVQPAKVAAQIAVAKVKDYPVVHSFSGKLAAEKQSNLSTRMMGQVTRIYARPGQKVKQGDLLLQIRNQDILAKKAQVEANRVEAETAFESAEKDLKRFEALYQSGSASDKEIEDMRSRYQMTKARLEAVNQMEKEVEESLRYASIRAPYSGIITGKFVQEGDMANPGMPLLSIENPSQWKVLARIPESDIGRLALNDSVKVHFNAADGLELNGVIAEINPSSANTGNQFEAKVLLADNNEQLYSGMYATVLYEHGTHPLIMVPKTALVQRGQLVGLYTVSQTGNALLRWVKTGKTHEDSIEILSGLTDGESYIQISNGKLFDGALVENK